MEPVPSPVSSPPNSNTPTIERHGRRSYPAITHFAILATLLIPLAFTPYLLTRRQISALRRDMQKLSTLRRDIQQLDSVNGMLRKDLNASIEENGSLKDDLRRLRGLLHEMMEETEALRTEGKEKEELWRERDVVVDSELQRLLRETRNARMHGECLRNLGASLGDIAGFMHEMELRMPLLGKRGRVEHLRTVALKMQDLPLEESKSPVDDRKS